MDTQQQWQSEVTLSVIKKTLSSRNSKARALTAVVLQQHVMPSQIKHFHHIKKFREFVLCFNPRSRIKNKNTKIVQYFHSDTARKKQSHASNSNASDKLNLDTCLCKSGMNTDANMSIEALLIKANPCVSPPVSVTASSPLYKLPYQ